MPRAQAESPFENLTPESRAEMLQGAYESALSDMSLESYESYFEDLKCRGIISALEFKAWEDLPISSKIAVYCFAILAFPSAGEEARAYAKAHLENLAEGRYD